MGEVEGRLRKRGGETVNCLKSGGFPNYLMSKVDKVHDSVLSFLMGQKTLSFFAKPIVVPTGLRAVGGLSRHPKLTVPTCK